MLHIQVLVEWKIHKEKIKLINYLKMCCTQLSLTANFYAVCVNV